MALALRSGDPAFIAQLHRMFAVSSESNVPHLHKMATSCLVCLGHFSGWLN
jgi:hypothetical protein